MGRHVATFAVACVAWVARVESPSTSGAYGARTHVSEILVTRLGLLASICQSTTRYQVMTRL